MDTDTKQSARHFLDLIKQSHRGKFKIYIGMSAGVGKTYRMLQEAHQLLEAGWTFGSDTSRRTVVPRRKPS